MASLVKRILKGSESRPNYAKRAKECGLQHVNILKIQKYLIDDWEEKIQTSEEKFSWDFVAKHLVKAKVYEMNGEEFDLVVNDFRRNGASNEVISYMEMRRIMGLRRSDDSRREFRQVRYY